MTCDRKVVIFCSSSQSGIDPKYDDAAKELVRALVGMDYTVVSGGTRKGTMGVVSDEVVAAGGRHVGVIPRFMESVVARELTETVWVDTMSERKDKMREGTCAAVALPGGVGTLEELVETLTLAKLQKYGGKIFALNIDGFYDKLIALLEHYVDTKMMDAATMELISFPKTVDELVKML